MALLKRTSMFPVLRACSLAAQQSSRSVSVGAAIPNEIPLKRHHDGMHVQTACRSVCHPRRGGACGHHIQAVRLLQTRAPETASSVGEGAVQESDAESVARTAALRVTSWGALANISLAITKYGSGVLVGSSALIADAAHSVSDLLSDVITLFVVDAARQPPDENHPYGHGRFEAVGSLFVSIVLIGTAGGVGYSAFLDLAEWYVGGAGTSTVADSGYGAVAIFACVSSLIIKEVLYHLTVRVGREIESQTLMANAWHHRSDAFSSVAALIGVGGALAGAPMLDPLAGLFVSALVAKVGVEIGWESLEEVTETAVCDDRTIKAVEDAAAATAGVRGIDRLRTRKMGPYSSIDVRVEVDPKISVSAARNVAEHLRSEIHRSARNVSEVLVHVTPYKQLPIAAGTGILMRPHTELEIEVRKALENSSDIVNVAHVMTHYVPRQGIHLKVDIVCDETITIRRARMIAQRAKLTLLKIKDVCSVDVDLDLEDSRPWTKIHVGYGHPDDPRRTRGVSE